MIKLTEKEARKLLWEVCIGECNTEEATFKGVNIDKTIKNWKQKGWIEKSKLEEFEEYYKKLYPGGVSEMSTTEIEEYILNLYNLAMEAIKEVQEGNK